MAADRETAPPVELTPRVCRYCRRHYLAPMGERWHACKSCAPTLYMAVEAVEEERKGAA